VFAPGCLGALPPQCGGGPKASLSVQTQIAGKTRHGQALPDTSASQSSVAPSGASSTNRVRGSDPLAWSPLDRSRSCSRATSSTRVGQGRLGTGTLGPTSQRCLRAATQGPHLRRWLATPRPARALRFAPRGAGAVAGAGVQAGSYAPPRRPRAGGLRTWLNRYEKLAAHQSADPQQWHRCQHAPIISVAR
jgi:hypothetical protein